MTDERRIAAFDFDGTLTRRDTLFGFLVHVLGLPRVARATVGLGPQAIAGRVRPSTEGQHRDRAKEQLLARLFAGASAEQVAEAGRAYAATLARRLRPEAQRCVDWHRSEGHELVIVSASLLAYLEPFAADEGFDHVIGVGLEADGEGRLTGRLTGPNVRGPEKVVRLREWLGGEEPTQLWTYGNSSGDHELIALNTHGGHWYGSKRRRPVHLDR